MKVSIKPGTEQKGLLRKKTLHTVTVQTLFTEEEKAICRTLQIEDHIVLEQAQVDPGFHLDHVVSEFMSGREFTFRFLLSEEAQDFIALLKERLAALKEHMNTYSAGPDQEEFEI